MKNLTQLITEKATLVISGYPTLGINLADLIDITIELCEDHERHPTVRTVKSVIKRAGFYKRGGRYYPENGSVLALPVATVSNSLCVEKHESAHVGAKSTQKRGDWRLRVYGGRRGA